MIRIWQRGCHVVQVPSRVRRSAPFPQPVCDGRSERGDPAPNGLVRHHDPALREEVLDVFDRARPPGSVGLELGREIRADPVIADLKNRPAKLWRYGLLDKLAPDIQWVESYVADNKTYCVYLAKDVDTIRKHAEISGFPASIVTEVRKMIDPTTARAD